MFISLFIVIALVALLAWLFVPIIVNEITHMGYILSDIVNNSELAERASKFLPTDIWQAIKDYASREEVEQISQVHPKIGKWLLAPCGSRWAAHITPFCQEGERYCGQPLWDKSVKEYPPRII